MPSHLPTIRHAVLSDTGRKRLANEDAVTADPRMGLFVVCDGVGGRPSGEAASQIIAHTLRHALRRRLRRLPKNTTLDGELIQTLLCESLAQMNQQMYTHSQQVPALMGMGCTLVAALIDARTMFFLHAGDSRCYLYRRGQLKQLTEDHTRSRQTFRESAETGDLIDLGERRLLMKYVGMPTVLEPSVGSIQLEPGDRVLLCSDGLTDPLSDLTLDQLLSEHAEPSRAAKALVDAANEAGGPDNITLAVIDYTGSREVTPDDLAKPPKTRPDLPHGVAEKTRDALALLESDMTWLQEGARESANPNRLAALAAAKRRLGKDDYRIFLERHPNQAAMHIFHQCCTAPDSSWRRQYQEHMQQLEAPLTRITGGTVRLSPILTGEETAMIYKYLWSDWRRVEQRYFAVNQREATSPAEATLDILIAHMLNSVQTLQGLLYFLPRFMRDL